MGIEGERRFVGITTIHSLYRSRCMGRNRQVIKMDIYMNRFFKLSKSVITLVMISLLFATAAICQGTEGWTPPAIGDWFTQMDALYSALIVIGGYLSAKVPVLNTITSATWRVLTWAILTGLGFWYFGDLAILKIAINYFFATSLYEVVLKGMFNLRSPKTDR